MKKPCHIIGACSCWGAQIKACEKGPQDLVDGRVFERLQEKRLSISEIEMLYPKKRASEFSIPFSQSLSLIREFNLLLTQSVKQAVRRGSFPIVIGGDHTNAIGTWSAFTPPFGLLWIDAHMDAHTMETSPSGAYHGMPVAALLGHGIAELAQLASINPILHPQNVALIGIRSFEEEEAALLKRLNVKIYLMEEVKKRGLKEILPEAIAHVAKGGLSYGISLDLDVFSLNEAPGVGSPAEGGIQSQEMLPLLSSIGKDPKLLGFEIVEFNPERDLNHKTRELVYQILLSLME